MTTFCLAFAIAASMRGECQPLKEMRIEAHDLRSVLRNAPELNDNLVFSASPLPGVKRILAGAELVRWAKAHGAEHAEARDVCFEWPMRAVPEEELVAAMKLALPEDSSVRVIESSRILAPAGPLNFPREGLRTPSPNAPGAPVLWHGYVSYAPHRRFLLWARVLVTRKIKRVVTVADLRAGEVIRPDQVTVESVETFPFDGPKEIRIEDFIDKSVRYSVKRGTVLLANHLQPTQDVARGEVLVLEARNGHASLKSSAQAEQSARIGELILVKNLSSGKLIQARLEAKGRAVVVPEPSDHIPLR